MHMVRYLKACELSDGPLLQIQEMLKHLRGTSPRREEYQEEDPLFAPILHRYGHALLEHAIATSGALGGAGADKDAFGNGPQAKTVASARVKEPATDKTAINVIEQGRFLRQRSYRWSIES